MQILSTSNILTLGPCSRHSVSGVYVVSSVHTPGAIQTNRCVLQSSRNTTPSSSLQVFPGDAYTAPDLLISADSPHVTKTVQSQSAWDHQECDAKHCQLCYVTSLQNVTTVIRAKELNLFNFPKYPRSLRPTITSHKVTEKTAIIYRFSLKGFSKLMYSKSKIYLKR